MKNKNHILVGTLLLLSAILLVGSSFLQPNSAFKSYGLSDPSKVFALDIAEAYSFAGETVTLDEHDLRERMDKELLVNTYWQSNMMLMIKRSNKYFPTIERILKEEGVPDDFKYLAVIESGLENVNSPAGAKGFWQIMKTTGREMGLEVNSNVDERYHIENATRVACTYLKKAKKKLGSWTLAAASYNRGISGINRLLEKQQAETYYDLLLNSETRRYVFRILAMKEILSNPTRYGFVFEVQDLYTEIPVYTVEVDTAISNIARFAKTMGVNYKQMKIHNPWLLQNHLNNKSRKLYHIKLPKAVEIGP
ncbi:lytic transglycosylase domain-containing protein [Flavobacteriaceae bacterium]|nr:lytic transglycosylase domain-containing protein [Flavobacteriaceae bacterium]MDA9351508.1 lytic transglycosylase domain-containing protein [Flavobacteriaceae bacterium]MDA9359336.1 lytic transglycosylase domain-containing protein [Flavobacteriaceae bacterium]MDB4066641.1 lytic transglycosylase domain-containing protein [Flavobacteriaceae bacterium]|tara:strand:- start:745 stop:1668 length:924 start_codon:yes stop_codon:yes gene_type:complete